MSSPRLILKIFSGNYMGSELELADTSYLMGRSLDCDITVDDDQLAEESLILTLLDSAALQIQILSTEQLVGLNGVLQEQANFIAQLYDLIQIGSFAFAVGRLGEPWPEYGPIPTLARKTIEQFSASPSEDALSADLALEDEISSNLLEIDDNNMSDEFAMPEATESSTDSLDPIPSEPSKGFNYRRVLIVLGAMVVLVGGVLLFINQTENQKVVTAQQAKISLHAHKMQQQSKMIAKQKLISAALITAVRGLLDGFGYSQIVVASGVMPGEIVVSGYMEQADRWSQMTTMLKRDIPQLTKLTDQVDTPQQRKEKLELMIKQHNLSEVLQVFLTPAGLVARGSLSNEEESNWQLVVQEYQQAFQNQPSLHRVSDNLNWLDIKSVSFGKESYVVTTDGSRYMIGSPLSNGYVLEEITAKGLILRKGDSVRRYPLP